VPGERFAQNAPVLGKPWAKASAPNSSSTRFEPAMSVNRKVTVPDGNPLIKRDRGERSRRAADHREQRTPPSP
jgi:hypothetical protein